jgi:hypothetical protein
MTPGNSPRRSILIPKKRTEGAGKNTIKIRQPHGGIEVTEYYRWKKKQIKTDLLDG